MSIRIIARQSRLSQQQVQEAMAHFPEIDYLLETLPSYGDEHQQISLLNSETPANMFTRELDEVLISGRADIAIHSAKDLPYPLDDRLEVIALLPPFVETHQLQGYLAITARRGRTDLKALFERVDVLHRQGHVTLVGFGPGDPELLTVKAVKALQQADVIFYDDLIGKDYLETLTAEKIYVGKRCGKHHAEQSNINRLLLKAAREGKEVVRLKGGDPMVFGHAGEEIEYLQSNLVSVSVIPGITTASALAATTKVSLTQRGISSSVSLVNGHASSPIIPDTDTIIYYMGGSCLPRIRASLKAAGWADSTPVLLVHNVSLPDEQTFETTVDQLGNTTYPTPVIALVGDVARLRHQTAADVKRTLYTGSECPNASYIHTPLIAFEPISYTIPTQDYDYLLFTSRYAVKYWKGGFQHRIVSIGATTTQALREAGAVDIEQVEIDDSYGVIDYFSSQPYGRVLIPRSNLALDIIPNGLQELGFDVIPLTIYNNVYPRHVRRVNLTNIQRVVFTSPSTIDNFIKTYGSLPSHIDYVTRGRITAQHLKSRQNEKIQNIQVSHQAIEAV